MTDTTTEQPTLKNYIPKDQADADAHGLRMDGLPNHDHTPISQGGGRKDLVELIRKFTDQELANQNDLHQFCETGRALMHRLAVEVHLAAGELTAGAKEMGRQNRAWGAVFKMRRVTKHLEKIAGSLADDAADFVRTWHAFEGAFGDLLNGRNKPKKPKGFTITGV